MASALVEEKSDSVRESARMSNPERTGKKFPGGGAVKLGVWKGLVVGVLDPE